MTKEDLKRAFDLMLELDNTVDKLSEMDIQVVDTPLFNTAGCLFDMLLESNFEEEGQDTINWWFFEKRYNPELKMYNAEGVEICTDFDSLWDYVKAYKK